MYLSTKAANAIVQKITTNYSTVRELSFLRGLAGGVSKVRAHYWDESNNPAYKLFLG